MSAVVAGSYPQHRETCSERLFEGGGVERNGSTVLMLGAPPFCACVCTSCSGAGKCVEKHNRQQPWNWKVLSCFSPHSATESN